MFVSIFAWAQILTAGYVAAAPDAGQETPFAGLMTLGFGLVFAGWLLFVGVREVLRMRREEQRTRAFDFHRISLEGLGPTMADGGEPGAPDEREGRGQTR